MIYNGNQIIEITERPQDFMPHRMLCWEKDPNHPLEEYVIAIVKRSDDILFITDHSVWTHGAEIPEEPKPRRATNRELAEWLAKGNGQKSGNKGIACVSYSYGHLADDCEIEKNVVVRKWEDNEWHEPTVDYMGL